MSAFCRTYYNNSNISIFCRKGMMYEFIMYNFLFTYFESRYQIMLHNLYNYYSMYMTFISFNLLAICVHFLNEANDAFLYIKLISFVNMHVNLFAKGICKICCSSLVPLKYSILFVFDLNEAKIGLFIAIQMYPELTHAN